MSLSVNNKAQVPGQGQDERQKLEALLDQIIELGDGLLADGSRLVDDLDSAIAMDNVLLRLEDFNRESRLEPDFRYTAPELIEPRHKLCRSLTELKVIFSDLRMPHTARYDVLSVRGLDIVDSSVGTFTLIIQPVIGLVKRLGPMCGMKSC